MKSKIMALAGLGLVTSLGVAACGSGSSSSSGASGVSYDAASTGVVNPSTHKGGTLNFGMTSDVDSTDPGNTYLALSVNFDRLYARPLTTYASKPGQAGGQIVPDLADGLGVSSADMKTWTFKIKKGIKYEDGTEVKAADVKYAVSRTLDRGVLGNGPSYFTQLLIDGSTFKGPYKDKNQADFKGVTTPDDYTVVFHLNTPFPEFNYVVAFGQTAPVPQAKDTGAQYALHPVSTGPYMWKGNYSPGKGGTLVRNPNWDASTDPNRKQLPDTINLTAGMKQEELDARLIAGTMDVDANGTGVSDAARQQILTNPKLKANADDPYSGFSWYLPIDTEVIPNINCRKAIIDGADRDAMWRAYGAQYGGEMSTSLMPPNISGRQPSTLYPVKPGDHGDVAKAKADLVACGKPNGFAVNIGFRAERPKEQATALALQQSLAKVGIQLTLKGYPSSTYTTSQFGSHTFNKTNNIGLGTYGWLADWPSGYGFLNALTSSSAIVDSGNSNVTMLKDPTVDAAWKKVVTLTDQAAREKLYNQVDNTLLAQAGVLPNVYAKSLDYRSPHLTNVLVQGYYGMYDYANLGVTK